MEEQLGQAKQVLTKFDMPSGFKQFPIAEESKHLTSIKFLMDQYMSDTCKLWGYQTRRK
jgi:hypothetical protein